MLEEKLVEIISQLQSTVEALSLEYGDTITDAALTAVAIEAGGAILSWMFVLIAFGISVSTLTILYKKKWWNDREDVPSRSGLVGGPLVVVSVILAVETLVYFPALANIVGIFDPLAFLAHSIMFGS